jgi:hypothetical protein
MAMVSFSVMPADRDAEARAAEAPPETRMEIDMKEVHDTRHMKDEARCAAVRALHNILKRAAF